MTLMTAGLVLSLWAVAGPRLEGVFTDAIDRVVAEFWKSVDEYPLIPVGAPDPYVPAAAGHAARSFLHHQVRSMVGCLALIGRGQWGPQDMRRALEARDRAALGLNAPPHGLYFVEAIYPEPIPKS